MIILPPLTHASHQAVCWRLPKAGPARLMAPFPKAALAQASEAGVSDLRASNGPPPHRCIPQRGWASGCIACSRFPVLGLGLCVSAGTRPPGPGHLCAEVQTPLPVLLGTQAVFVVPGSSADLGWKNERREKDSGQGLPWRNQVVGGAEGWERRGAAPGRDWCSQMC